MKASDNVDYKSIIGQRVKDFRSFIGKTQLQIKEEAEQIGIKFEPTFLSMVENGRRDCHPLVFVAFHLLYNANIDYFFSGRGTFISDYPGKNKNTDRTIEEIVREIEVLFQTTNQLQNQINLLTGIFNNQKEALNKLILPINEAMGEKVGKK